MKNLLSVKKLSAKYNEVILNDISFDVHPGELICLIGANGSGKSSLLYSLANIEISKFNFSKKSICVCDKFVDQLSRYEISKYISLMTQYENCVWNFSVYDFICLGNYFSNKIDGEKIFEIIKLLDIEYLLNKNINCISGGEFQKIRIARSLVQDCSVMLFDEPTSALDINYQFNLLSKIKKVVKEKNICAIISIHDINLASIFADKIFLLKKNNSLSQNENQLLVGTSDEILNSKDLSKAFNTNFKTFLHPEYNKLQIYVKGF